jgi:hypothetical protein
LDIKGKNPKDMNIIEPKMGPDPENESAAFFHARARASGFTNLFDWFLSRQDTDNLEVLLICCQNYVVELINEINDDPSAPDGETQLFRDHAREIGFDKLMDLFLHDTCLDCAEAEACAAESYIDELLDEITKSEARGNQLL